MTTETKDGAEALSPPPEGAVWAMVGRLKRGADFFEKHPDAPHSEATPEYLRNAADLLTALDTLYRGARNDLASVVGERDRLKAALRDLLSAATIEVNEKGGGGYILARMSDARAALSTEPETK